MTEICQLSFQPCKQNFCQQVRPSSAIRAGLGEIREIRFLHSFKYLNKISHLDIHWHNFANLKDNIKNPFRKFLRHKILANVEEEFSRVWLLKFCLILHSSKSRLLRQIQLEERELYQEVNFNSVFPVCLALSRICFDKRDIWLKKLVTKSGDKNNFAFQTSR